MKWHTGVRRELLLFTRELRERTMDDPINWHDLEIFHAVLEQRSFSGAARVLGISQPTVSRHIDSLEQSLGRELFTRTSGGLEPSTVALDLGQYAMQMSEGMFGIRRVLDGKEEAPQGIVTISLPHGIGGIPLARAFDGFHEHYPDIAIDLKFGPPQNNLGRREADIDVRLQEPTEPELICKSMGSIHFGIYAAESYLQRHGLPRQPADLNEHFLPYADEYLMEPVLKSLAEFGVEPRRFPFHCSGNTVLAQVLGYMGVTLSMIPIGLEHSSMQRLFPQYHWSAPPLWLNMHSSLRRNVRIRVVWDWLMEYLPRIIENTRS
jgi:DNA-binding transcriptional LysR family regulator